MVISNTLEQYIVINMHMSPGRNVAPFERKMHNMYYTLPRHYAERIAIIVISNTYTPIHLSLQNYIPHIIVPGATGIYNII